MTEEVKIENTPDPEQTNEPSPVEVRARELGWRPKDEFSGDEDNFVDAKEFVQRQPLFEKIEHQSRELKNVKKTLDALKGHYTQVREVEYQRALAALQASKAEAISEADGQRAVAIDAQIAKATNEFQRIRQVEETPTENDPAEFVSWKNKNAWYEKDESMRMLADAYGVKLQREGLSPPEVLEAVTKRVKAEFPHKFVNPNKANAPDVGVSGASSRSSSNERFELSDMERSIMNTLVRDGTMTKEQYITDLKKIRNR
jgi:hypothetical protein